MTPHVYTCPLRWGDMDAQGHVNNAVYVDFLQEARVDFLLRGPAVGSELLESGVLVVSHAVEYLRPVVYGGPPLVIHLWVDAIGGSRFVMGYDLYVDDELVGRARTGLVPYDLATASLRRLLPAERAALHEHLAPAPPLRPLRAGPVGAGAARHPLWVRWSDLDAYGHANNVKFYDYIQEGRIALLAEAFPWSPEDLWVVVRQDLDYRRPLDFRAEPYEVATAVAEVGSRSFTLVAEIREPGGTAPYATARTVVVRSTPLTEPQRAALLAHV